MKKDKKLLSYEEGKKLFDKFSLDTLDSIDLLYDAAEQESSTSFSVIFDKKYEEEVNKGNFEGRNEITRGTRIDNFDKKVVCAIYSPKDDYGWPEISESDAYEDDYRYKTP